MKNDAVSVVVRSGFAGVAAAILAVAFGSQAGLGGMIGVAEGMDRDQSADALNLPSGTPRLSSDELTHIDQILTNSMSEMDAMRAGTDDKIEYMRSVAGSADLELRD
jgi:hypothetical protein